MQIPPRPSRFSRFSSSPNSHFSPPPLPRLDFSNPAGPIPEIFGAKKPKKKKKKKKKIPIRIRIPNKIPDKFPFPECFGLGRIFLGKLLNFLGNFKPEVRLLGGPGAFIPIFLLLSQFSCSFIPIFPLFFPDFSAFLSQFSSSFFPIFLLLSQFPTFIPIFLLSSQFSCSFIPIFPLFHPNFPAFIPIFLLFYRNFPALSSQFSRSFIPIFLLFYPDFSFIPIFLLFFPTFSPLFPTFSSPWLCKSSPHDGNPGKFPSPPSQKNPGRGFGRSPIDTKTPRGDPGIWDRPGKASGFPGSARKG
ncbi:PREDICTED: uncharacterized protein LOC108447909 isoform X2 [Corvus brachyrhynchos]|uniref:uncharacterized protein LOC108447909 isoform X2 n=1 Tax=Corvus brachyrhynchos TaxID=85066 RepID=UPI0008166CD6|nr:PREDICTED: uncharacterized protein LOC108447909 isoform X2 [Corvus brachyrhynchos]